ncbi:MAG: hypothetical protein Q9162_004010 [Coniocarpon cinnabarinum]
MRKSLWPIARLEFPLRCPACGHLPTRRSFGPLLPVAQVQQRYATNSANAAKYKRADVKSTRKKRKGNTAFRLPNLKLAEQFSLCDAMRYIRAFEVGRTPTTPKYELAIRFRTLKNGPVVRNRLRLPHPVDTSTRICVICPPDSKHSKAAEDAGAVLVGEEQVFSKIKAGQIEFDRCIAHQDSIAALSKAGLGRILGPRGLMPSAKTGTVVKDVGSACRDVAGGSEYRERSGVVRIAVGHLGFGPEMMQRNIRALMENVKRDCALISDRMLKEIHEVVLSSTGAPGFSLTGDYRSVSSPEPEILGG